MCIFSWFEEKVINSLGKSICHFFCQGGYCQMTTKLMCLWEVSLYGCLREVSHNGHNRQRFTHVAFVMKYIVHGWDA